MKPININSFLSDIDTLIKNEIGVVELECEVEQIKEYTWMVYLVYKDSSATIRGTIYKKNYHIYKI